MKLDYDFIKEILLALEENKEHLIPLKRLMMTLKISENTKDETDKLAGHLKVLGDNFYVESSSIDYGFRYGADNYLTINTTVKYRLTAKGYEFLDILKNDNILNKIKKFSISTVYEIGKQALLKLVLKQ